MVRVCPRLSQRRAFKVPVLLSYSVLQDYWYGFLLKPHRDKEYWYGLLLKLE